MYQEIRFRAIVLLVVFVGTSILSSCSLFGSSQTELDGSRWQLQSLNGSGVAESLVVTAEFNDGRISGSSGCNSYGAGYTAADGKLKVETIAMTEMACLDQGVMETEQQYLASLGGATGYKMTADQLELLDDAGNVVLVFVKQ
jgi:heat shock protein HslJ